MAVMVDVWCASYPAPPAVVTLDIDDTLDVVHDRQQLSLFNAHYDERCFLPRHKPWMGAQGPLNGGIFYETVTPSWNNDGNLSWIVQGVGVRPGMKVPGIGA